MLRFKIVDPDPTSPQMITVPAKLQNGVERAKGILEFDLLRSLSDFDIDATWQFVKNSNGGTSAILDLTTSFDGQRMGITGYPLDSDSFADDKHIRAALDRPTWNFLSLLSYVNKMEVKRDRERLEASVLAEAK